MRSNRFRSTVAIVAGFALTSGGAAMGLASLTGTAGCAAFAAALPTVAEITSDAVAVLGLVQTAVTGWFKSHPAEPTAQAKIEAAIQKAQAALVVGEQALAGVENATAGQTAAAFSSFATAWAELMTLLQPLGIVPAQPTQPVTALPMVATDAGAADGGAVRAEARPGLVVPVPLAVRAVRGTGR